MDRVTTSRRIGCLGPPGQASRWQGRASTWRCGGRPFRPARPIRATIALPHGPAARRHGPERGPRIPENPPCIPKNRPYIPENRCCIPEIRPRNHEIVNFMDARRDSVHDSHLLIHEISDFMDARGDSVHDLQPWVHATGHFVPAQRRSGPAQRRSGPAQRRFCPAVDRLASMPSPCGHPQALSGRDVAGRKMY